MSVRKLLTHSDSASSASVLAPAATLLPRDFAALRGITERHVFRLIKDHGMPAEPDGRIDPEKAGPWCDENDIGGGQSQRTRTKGKNAAKTLAEVRLEFEREKLRKIRLELAEAEGELVNRADVRKLIFNHRKAERDAHMAWVMRTSPALATELGVDATKMFAALDSAMREHLHHLSVEPVGGVLTDH